MIQSSARDLEGTDAPFCYWPMAELPKIQEAFREVITGSPAPQGYTLKFCRTDGSEFPVRLRVNALRSGRRILGWMAAVVDISTQVKQAEALAESELKLRGFTENIEDVVYVFDNHAKKILYVNAAYEKLWGRSCQSL